MQPIESVSIPGYSGRSQERNKKNNSRGYCNEVIDSNDFNAIADFLKSLGLILVSIYKLGGSNKKRSYSIAAALSKSDPVQLMTADIDDAGLVVDELNKYEADITNIRQKIYHQQFFHIYNNTGVLALSPMYLYNSLNSLEHHEFKVPMQLREFLNVKT